MATISRSRTPLTGLQLETLSEPALIHLIYPQIFPEALVTHSVPWDKLKELEIWERVGETLTDDDRLLLFYVGCGFSLNQPEVDRKTIEEFGEFVFFGHKQEDVLEGVMVSMGSQTTLRKVSTQWLSLLDRIRELIEQYYDLSILLSFVRLKNMLSARDDYADATAQRWKLVSNFCNACYTNRGPSDPQPLLRFWVKKMGGDRE
ncbi:MAG: hypothetical protein M1840_006335 [Geoglossum simile]|nr:MAG: hypothetical protein M1840_006335 [Geoglossum simile]